MLIPAAVRWAREGGGFFGLYLRTAAILLLTGGIVLGLLFVT